MFRGEHNGPGHFIYLGATENHFFTIVRRGGEVPPPILEIVLRYLPEIYSTSVRCKKKIFHTIESSIA
jgi:hypothetical protein